jgi:hypothetical protein
VGGGVGGWEDKGGVWVVFININDMCKNDVGKGGVRVYEAYEVKSRVALVRVPFYLINLLPTSLLYISILLIRYAYRERASVCACIYVCM